MMWREEKEEKSRFMLVAAKSDLAYRAALMRQMGKKRKLQLTNTVYFRKWPGLENPPIPTLKAVR